MTTSTVSDLLPSDDFNAGDPSDLAALARLTGQPTGIGDGTAEDLLVSLRALHAEMQRRQNSHRLLTLLMDNSDQNRALFADPGPLGQEARRLADRIHWGGYMVGVGGVAYFDDPAHLDPGPDAVGPHGPTADTHPTDRTDAARSDRASSPFTTEQGTAPSRQTEAAPCHPATRNEHEVPTS